MLNMALFCKENHCGSCQKAFCCFSCRSKHENIVHQSYQKSGTESIRKVLAPIRNGTFQSNNSLAKIPELAQLKSFQSKIPINDRKKNSIVVYKDHSQLNDQLKIHDTEKSSKIVKDSFTQQDYNSKNDVLTDEHSIHQENKRNIPFISEKDFNVTVDVGNSLVSFVIFSEEKKENIPPQQILDTTNYHITTAGNTPPRINTEDLENLKSADSVIEVQSSLDQDSSIYCACSENLVKSDVNSNWSSALSAMCDLSNNEIKEISENSSIYFACSEFLSRELSGKTCPKTDCDMEGFKTFEENSKLASTKLQMTVSFAKEVFESENRTKIECDSTEYLTPSLEENTDAGVFSINESVETDNSTETITSDFCSEPVSVIFDECSSVNLEPPERREYLSDWVRACATQTSVNSSISSLLDISGADKENCGTAIEVIPPVFEHVPVTNEHRLPIAQPTYVVNGDRSLWQSFSNSLQRAYNSTKEICTNIGRKNKSKRGLDDISEDQPKPKRPKVLCRPPIRDNPKVIFRQDGDFRRPVIAYDKGTQTDGDSIFY
ncbi:uncharacterized protein LOC123321038 isoform X1 [Coccinella septempunctata]|uniref:uncharacterized protein LOC123321038 isoform X1 n=1 Tax=Coccinella septempunctata TaxID=41139 RepID=UPI001D05E8AC|nr:uncharacterized protein LOC123321038 isoform X1 [Coccinella septempunctata]